MTEHARTDPPQESGSGDAIAVQLPRDEVEALLLAVDALQPLLDRLRPQIAPVPPVHPRPDGAKRVCLPVEPRQPPLDRPRAQIAPVPAEAPAPANPPAPADE